MEVPQLPAFSITKLIFIENIFFPPAFVYSGYVFLGLFKEFRLAEDILDSKSCSYASCALKQDHPQTKTQL